MGCLKLTYRTTLAIVKPVKGFLFYSQDREIALLNSKEKTGAGDYRYGYQGQKKDDEVKGKGNSVNYKYRMHDPRLGRFLAVDPLHRKLSFNSPYAFSENRVVDGAELEEQEVTKVTEIDNTGKTIITLNFSIKVLATSEEITTHKLGDNVDTGSLDISTWSEAQIRAPYEGSDETTDTEYKVGAIDIQVVSEDVYSVNYNSETGLINGVTFKEGSNYIDLTDPEKTSK